MKVLEKQELNNVAGGFFWGLIINIRNNDWYEIPPGRQIPFAGWGNGGGSLSNGSTWG